MNAHHCPLIMVTRWSAWVECRCGWLSSLFADGVAASAAWARHVAGCLAREATEAEQ